MGRQEHTFPSHAREERGKGRGSAAHEGVEPVRQREHRIEERNKRSSYDRKTEDDIEQI